MLKPKLLCELKFPIQIYTDGAAKGHGEGLASSGFVVYESEMQHRYTMAITVGVRSNNYAEYVAFILALDWVLARVDPEMQYIEFITDSQLIQRQILGEYSVKNPIMAVLHGMVWERLGKLQCWAVRHVRGHQGNVGNEAADFACNQAIKFGKFEKDETSGHTTFGRSESCDPQARVDDCGRHTESVTGQEGHAHRVFGGDGSGRVQDRTRGWSRFDKHTLEPKPTEA